MHIPVSGVNPEKRSILAEWGFPLLVGVGIELSSDLLKFVSHQVSISFPEELSELLRADFWLGILFTVGLTAGALWILESWPRAHPNRWVRISLVVVSVIVVGILDPLGRAFNDKILAAYRGAQIGEPMSIVIHRFQYDAGILIEPKQTDREPRGLDCTGRCWLRLTYLVPAIFRERDVILEFDRDGTLIRKCDIDGKCVP